MKNKSYFKTGGIITVPLLFLFLLIIIPLVSAVPPVTQVQQFVDGYIILGSPTEVIQQNQNYQYNFFAYNISNGKQIQSDTADCTFYMANNRGTVLFSTIVPKIEGYWALTINGANFSEAGHYPYGVRCNSTSLGGATVSYFTVTAAGLNYNSSFFWLILALGFGLVLFGLWKEDYTLTTLGSFALVFVGMYLLYYGIADVKNTMSNAIAIVTLAIAGYIMVSTGLNFVRDNYD